MKNVAVVGASLKHDRYSNMAVRVLAGMDYNPIPVAPVIQQVLGRKAYPTLIAVPEEIDTVTMYLRASRQTQVIEDAIRIRPRRIIFNPGSENPDQYERLSRAGIEVVEGCTLVMLRTGRF